jgi:hypothetical protein
MASEPILLPRVHRLLQRFAFQQGANHPTAKPSPAPTVSTTLSTFTPRPRPVRRGGFKPGAVGSRF